VTVKLRGLGYVGAALLAASLVSPPVQAAPAAATDGCAGAAWMDPSRSPDERADLAPGQTRHVLLHLTPRSFARWNTTTTTTTTNGWDVPDGTYRLFVGTSSADLPLAASLRLTGAKVAP
jgi:hypothetical protein